MAQYVQLNILSNPTLIPQNIIRSMDSYMDLKRWELCKSYFWQLPNLNIQAIPTVHWTEIT